MEMITVRELIHLLEALPEEDKDKPVTCSYDGGYSTGVYGITGVRDGVVWLDGD